jgi:hypothetical protein
LLSVTDNSGVIEFRNEKTGGIHCPIQFNNGDPSQHAEIRRSTKAHRYFEKMCCVSTQSELLPVPVAAISAPFGHSRAHYVEVHWYFNGDHAVVLELGKNKYLPFLNWLQQASGTKWVDWREHEKPRSEVVLGRTPDK